MPVLSVSGDGLVRELETEFNARYLLCEKNGDIQKIRSHLGRLYDVLTEVNLEI